MVRLLVGVRIVVSLDLLKDGPNKADRRDSFGRYAWMTREFTVNHIRGSGRDGFGITSTGQERSEGYICRICYNYVKKREYCAWNALSIPSIK